MSPKIVFIRNIVVSTNDWGMMTFQNAQTEIKLGMRIDSHANNPSYTAVIRYFWNAEPGPRKRPPGRCI